MLFSDGDTVSEIVSVAVFADSAVTLTGSVTVLEVETDSKTKSKI